MVARVAVTTAHFISSDARAKKAAVLFDRFAVFGLSTLRDDGGGWGGVVGCGFPGGAPEDGWQARFNWLLEQGLLYDETMRFANGAHACVEMTYSSGADPGRKICRFAPQQNPHAGESDHWTDLLRGALTHNDGERMIRNWTSLWRGQQKGPLAVTCRHVATSFRADPNCDPTVVGQATRYGPDSSDPAIENGRDVVVRMVLNALPEPDENTPWEAILQLRNDPKARVALARLRTWMSGIARTVASAAEVEDELMALLDDYESSMRLHRIKMHRGVVEAFLTTSAEVAQALLAMRWGAVANAIFDMSRAEITLMEAEKTAPGRAVAYLAHLRSKSR